MIRWWRASQPNKRRVEMRSLASGVLSIWTLPLRKVIALVLLFAADVPPVLGQVEIPKLVSCFEARIAPLRLSQLDQGIALCTTIIEDRAAAATLRGEALIQRGLMRGRRWAIIQILGDALQGIADISEGLRLNAPANERMHQILLVRAQLYAVTGQTRKAYDDYRTVLDSDPANDAARTGLSRLGRPEGL